MKRLLIPKTIVLALIAFVTMPGCSQQAKLEKSLAKANDAFEAGEYPYAEIEYKRVLQIDSSILEALGNLGLVYHRQGRLREAHPFLTRASAVDPNAFQYRRALASLLLEAGDVERAWEEATFILENNPQDPLAPLVLQGAAVRAGRLQEARSILESISRSQKSAPLLVALGLLDANEANLGSAEALFREAIALDPKLSNAHTALGAVLTAQNKLDEAERAYRNGYEAAGNEPSKRLRYVRFKLETGNQDEAMSLLEATLEQFPNFVSGISLKAQILAENGRLDDALPLSERVLQLTPYNPAAIIFDSRLKLFKGDHETAIRQLERLTELYSDLDSAHYQLAVAYLAADERVKAGASLLRTIAINPNHSEAILLQAGLDASQGSASNALISLEKLIEKEPNNIAANSLLARIHAQNKDFDDAIAIYDTLADLQPSNPQPPQLAAEIYLQQGNKDAAIEALQVSLSRNPIYIPSLERITELDIADKNFDSALARLDSLLADSPDSASLHFLKGKTQLAMGANAPGEASLEKAIELQPKLKSPHVLLSTHYIANGQKEKALDRLNAIVALYPEDTSVLMRLGNLLDSMGNYDDALALYRKILDIDANDAVALNNIAYSNVEYFNNVDDAFTFGMKARELMPNNPVIADTLGWIQYKRGELDQALSLLKESVDKIPNHPEIQYHLAKIHLARGESSEAKTAFNKALELGLDGDKAAEARQAIEGN